MNIDKYLAIIQDIMNDIILYYNILFMSKSNSFLLKNPWSINLVIENCLPYSQVVKELIIQYKSQNRRVYHQDINE